MFGEENEYSFVVSKIKKYDGDIYVYGHPKWDDFYVLIPKDIKVEIGDKVIYLDYAWNAGDFVRIEKK